MTAPCPPSLRALPPVTSQAGERARWGLAALALLAGCAAILPPVQAADEMPPIKPGLWEMVMESQQVDGRPVPNHTAEMNRQLSALPPDVRRQVEAQMKERGVMLQNGESGGDAVRMCLTQELLRTRHWQPQQGRCENQVVSRTGKTWRWKAACSQPPSQSEGSTTFLSNESYVSESRTSTDVNGRLQTIAIKHRAKWITSDCRGVRPMKPDGQP